MMKFISGGVIEIDREMSDLDAFVIDFVEVLERHTDYVIVSGYVSILLGRARASEDVDFIIPGMDTGGLRSLMEELERSGFYCLNEKKTEAHEHMMEGLALRFARKGNVIPNAEVKFAKTRIDDESIGSKVTVSMSGKRLSITRLEIQVAFKEAVLKSPKDIEDARHIRNVSEGHLDESMIKRYKEMLHGIYG